MMKLVYFEDVARKSWLEKSISSADHKSTFSWARQKLQTIGNYCNNALHCVMVERGGRGTPRHSRKLKQAYEKSVTGLSSGAEQES